MRYFAITTGLQHVDGISPSKQSSDEEALSQAAEERVFVDDATERHELQGSSIISDREVNSAIFANVRFHQYHYLLTNSTKIR